MNGDEDVEDDDNDESDAVDNDYINSNDLMLHLFPLRKGRRAFDFNLL